MRKLDRSLNVYKNHVSAVMDVDFSPTGEEVVTRSTTRHFVSSEQRRTSEKIYHTKRMQHIFQLARHWCSVHQGSDDTNVRVWRTNASDRLAIKSATDTILAWSDAALKGKDSSIYKSSNIAETPSLAYGGEEAGEIKMVELEAWREDNDRRHSRPGSKPYIPERRKHVRGTAIKDDGEK